MKKRIALVLTIFALVPLASSAHERQVIEIGGAPYLFIVGSLNEPVAVDDKTGVDLRVLKADSKNPTDSKAVGAKPVTGLESTLKVELSAGTAKRTLDLAPAFNDPGAYRAPFYPTVATTLTYRFFGTIDNTPVNLSFTCNPGGHPQTEESKNRTEIAPGIVRTYMAGTFGCPQPKEALGFPEKSAGVLSLARGVRAGSWGLTIGLLALVLAVIALVRTARKNRAS